MLRQKEILFQVIDVKLCQQNKSIIKNNGLLRDCAIPNHLSHRPLTFSLRYTIAITTG